MRNPLQAWRSGTRWPLVSIGLVVALVLLIGILEAIGWPFLAGPLQSSVAKALERRVILGSESGEDGRVRIGLLGSVRVSAPLIEIGSPDWSEAPHMLRAQNAYLKLDYLDLWRASRGGPLNVRALEASDLEANLERKEDGRASWQFGQVDKKPEAEAKSETPPALPTFESLKIDSGKLAYHDAVLPAKIDASFALRDRSGTTASATTTGGLEIKAGGDDGKADKSGPAEPVKLAAGESGLKLQATGSWRKLPVKIDLRTAGALAFLDQGEAARAQPVKIAAKVGQTELSFDGSTTDPLNLSALKGEFRVSGASLASVGTPLGITLPETPSFKTNGELEKSGAVWNARVATATIGSSRLAGSFKYDTGPKVPLLSGTLSGERLVLLDLGPAIGAPAAGTDKRAKTKGRGKIIPDKRFDLPSLRAMDADVKVDIAEFDTGTDVLASLKPFRSRIVLKGGVLTVSDIEASTAKGQLLGAVKLDGSGKLAKWNANVKLVGVDLAQWLKIERSGDAPPYLSGKLDARVDVAGAGRSTAEILGSLGGTVRAHMRSAAVSHLAIEALGVDVAQAIGIAIAGDKQLKILCNVIDLQVERGLVKPRLLVVNTNDSTVWIDGILSLKTESLGLKAVVAPKDFSPLSLRSPINISGTLSNPSVSIEAGKLAAKAGAAAVLGALVAPLAAVIPFIDTGSEDEAKQAGAQCAALAERGSGAKLRRR